MAIVEVTSSKSRHLQDIADSLAAAKKVVVVTGAGISTNCGIPDFRSKDGLYSLINSQYQTTSSPTTRSSTLRNVTGKDLFDSSLWRDDRSISVFHKFISSLRRKIREEVTGASATHGFIRSLRDQRKLVRCYTQNIDGLEQRENLCTNLDRGKGSKARFTKKAMEAPRSSSTSAPGGMMDGGCEVVQLHGDLEVLRCTICRGTCGWEDDDHAAIFGKGKAPDCPNCRIQDQGRRERGKRGIAVGTLRPNIVLYGEEHPSADALAAITTQDLKLCPDILLILGTSLKVHGLKTLIREFSKAVHVKTRKKGKVIFVNLTAPPASVWDDIIDYWVAMDCDEWVCSLRVRVPGLFSIQSELNLKHVKHFIDQPACEPKPSTKGREEEKENTLATKPLGPVKLKKMKTALLGQAVNVEKNAPELHQDLVGKGRVPPSKVRRLTMPPTSHRSISMSAAKDHISSKGIKVPPTPSSSSKRAASMLWKPRCIDLADKALPHSASLGSLGPYAYDNEDAIQATPSKRRRISICIWEDEDSSEFSNDLSPLVKKELRQASKRSLPTVPPQIGPGLPESQSLQASRHEKTDSQLGSSQAEPEILDTIRVESRRRGFQVRVPAMTHSLDKVVSGQTVGGKRKRA